MTARSLHSRKIEDNKATKRTNKRKNKNKLSRMSTPFFEGMRAYSNLEIM
jgi:hypothetical protein